VGLDGHGGQGVAGRRAGRDDLGAGLGLDLAGGAAAVADQEGGVVADLAHAAGDIGVEALDAVGEALFFEEFEGPVDGRRLGRRTPSGPKAAIRS
jgi:hypothetical protein